MTCILNSKMTPEEIAAELVKLTAEGDLYIGEVKAETGVRLADIRREVAEAIRVAKGEQCG